MLFQLQLADSANLSNKTLLYLHMQYTSLHTATFSLSLHKGWKLSPDEACVAEMHCGSIEQEAQDKIKTALGQVKPKRSEA